MDETRARQSSEQFIIVMGETESFKMAIVFSNGRNGGAQLGDQDLDLQDRGDDDGRVSGQRDSRFDLVEAALIGRLAGGVMRAQELVYCGRLGSLHGGELGPALEEVADQSGGNILKPA